MILLQIPTPPPGAIENVLITGAAIGSMVLLIKKLFQKKRADEPFPGRLEFHLFHDRLETLSQKVDALAGQTETRLDKLGSRLDEMSVSLHQRLAQIDAGLARVDERTKR